MDQAEAVRLAREGDERGYRFLYDTTYQSKFYLALKYMKNEAAAEDVMQEAYLKVFSKLDTLKDPAAFDSWIGRIVANTAKNMLKQKDPMLFTDIWAEEGDGYQIEDLDIENQPEMAYTRQETQELVHSLIDSLSDEQRMCILMFHIEGMPIRVIAETLGCSENTVKSRLNYGRKNLRAKAEELQRKGYKLYSAAPVWLLIYLLRQEESTMAAKGELAGGKKTWDKISETIRSSGRTGPGAAKNGLWNTAAGKAVVAVIGALVIGGAAYFAASYLAGMERPQPDTGSPSEISQEDAFRERSLGEQEQEGGDETEEDSPEREDVEEGAEPVQMTDADYPEMIAGNLTKEELEAVLAYGPRDIPEQGFSDTDYLEMLNAFCNISYSTGSPVEYYGPGADWQSKYSLSDVNRLFASFSDFAYTEDNDADTEYEVNVEGDMLIYAPATIDYSAKARILTAEYTKEEMYVYFTYSNTRYGQTDVSKKAILRPLENGLYRIVRIEEGTPGDGEGNSMDTVQEDMEGAESVMEAYSSVLDAVGAQEPGYDLSHIPAGTGVYHYFTHDLDNDGIEELIVGAEAEESVFYVHYCHIYTCEKTGGGYVARPCEGEFMTMAMYLPEDGNGLYRHEYIRGTGENLIYRVTLDHGKIVDSSSPERQFIMGSADEVAFQASDPEIEWRDISQR